MNKKTQTLVRHLNEDLAGELGAIIQYLTYGAKATGPYRPQLAQFFLAEIADEQLHAQFLANKIVSLGGEPTTVPREVPPARTNQEMLQAVLKAERQATRDYTQRAKEAVSIPVIVNGDVKSADDAQRAIDSTGCVTGTYVTSYSPSSSGPFDGWSDGALPAAPMRNGFSGSCTVTRITGLSGVGIFVKSGHR